MVVLNKLNLYKLQKKISRRRSIDVLPFIWKSSSHWHLFLRCLWHNKKTSRCSFRVESRRTFKKVLYVWIWLPDYMYVPWKVRCITISLRTLKRRLADHRLNKIGSNISDTSLQVIIKKEVIDPSSSKGYHTV